MEAGLTADLNKIPETSLSLLLGESKMVARIFTFVVLLVFMIGLAGCGDAISGPDLNQEAQCNMTCSVNADGSWTTTGFD